MHSEEKPMRIAVIGGGRRCKAFLEMLDARRFPRLKAEIVAVADHDEQAVGMQMAKSKGIFTTSDYHDFFQLEDLDLIIELTGNESLLEDFIANNPAKVRILEAAISRLFGDMIRFREEYLLDRRQLELVESLVESIFSSIQDQVLIMLPNRKILDANEALLNSLGLKQDQVVGKYCYQVTHQAIRPCNEGGHNCPLQESLDSGSTAHAIHEHFDRHNQPNYCEVTTIPLKNSAGEIELVLEVVRDITDELEKRVEQKTRIVTHNLAKLVHEDKMIALGKLVASAVHEINNPLSGINALARLMHKQLEEGPPNEEELKQFRYYMQLIDMESARCSKIVSNLLSFSRQQKMERKEFQLNELIEKVVLLFKHKIELQNIRLNLDLSPELPPMVGDPGQIQQCLVNLFFNAMEALPGGGEINVRTCWEASKHAIRLEVEDSGEGIPQEMLSQIFEPFFSTKNQDKGVGLGLSVVYGIIKEHHGSIFVKSEVGKGSNFIVRFFLLSDEEVRGDACSTRPRS